MKKCLFTGVATALATPFDDKGVNVKEFSRFIEFQINAGVNALVVCGTTGESSTMTKVEKVQAIKCALSTSKKRVPVIVGTGSNNTLATIEMSILAEELGADGLLIVTPYYNKTTQNGLIEHYKAIANSVNIPIILIGLTNILQFATAIEYYKIDLKKDKKKSIIVKNMPDKEQNESEDCKKINKIRQEINEYKHLKESLLSNEEEKIKTMNKTL